MSDAPMPLTATTAPARAARIFGRVAKGDLFSKANSEGLAEVGSSLLWGAAASS